MKKVSYTLITLVQTLLLTGSYMVYYFAKKKMGMIRYVVYKNQMWKQRYPLEMWRNISVVVLAVLTLIVLIALIKRHRYLPAWQIGTGVVMTVLTVLSVGFTMKESVETIKVYYFISPMLAAVAALQIIKAGAAIVTDVINRRQHGEE